VNQRLSRKQFLTGLVAGAGLAPIAGKGFLAKAAESEEARLGEGAALTGERTMVVPEQRLHSDYITYFPGIEYFHLGNGDIQAVIQYAPDRSPVHPPTFLAMTVMSPEHLSRKWSTYLFHPEKGFERTAARVVVDGKEHVATPDTFGSAVWEYPDQIPTVVLRWSVGEAWVEEQLFVPAEGGLLFRSVTIRNLSSRAIEGAVSLSMVPNFALFDDIGTDDKERVVFARGFTSMKLLSLEKEAAVSGRYDMNVAAGTLQPGESKTLSFVYAIDGAEKLLARKGWKALRVEASRFWSARNAIQTGNPTLDYFYQLSRTGIKAMVSRHGKRDGGFWEYQMEWAGDDAMAMFGMLQAGLLEEPRIVIEKVLEKSIGADGRTLEAGRLMPLELTEFVQNGLILSALWSYAAWTGDLKTVKKHWKTVKLVADFPLHDVFRDPKSKLMKNKREWWERSDMFGFKEGFELGYQFWVANGLGKAAELARSIGDSASAARWEKASAEIVAAAFVDPPFRLIEDGHLIKRRTVDGQWQRIVIPPDRSIMPPDSPISLEKEPNCEPDTSTVWPIIYGMVDPRSELAKDSLRWVEQIWNQRWDGGGYPRYNVTSEPDPPAPWPIASMLVARAYAETGDSEKVWRVIDWLKRVHGGISGGWFERYGPSITPPAPPVGVVGWVWEEMVSLVVYHLFGVRPGLRELSIRPGLLSGIDQIEGSFHVRQSTIQLRVTRSSARGARVNGKAVPMDHGALILPYRNMGKRVVVEMGV
jgi:hypothetical protein